MGIESIEASARTIASHKTWKVSIYSQYYYLIMEFDIVNYSVNLRQYCIRWLNIFTLYAVTATQTLNQHVWISSACKFYRKQFKSNKIIMHDTFFKLLCRGVQFLTYSLKLIIFSENKKLFHEYIFHTYIKCFIKLLNFLLLCCT